MALLIQQRFSRQNAAHIVTQLKHLLMFCLCGVFCGYLGILIGRLLTEGLYGKPYRVHLPVQENFSSYPAFKEGPTPTRRLSAKPVEERGYRILVMSSVGRSGSSFLGQLVAQLPNTVYVFEPLHFLQKQNAQGVTSDNSRELLSAIYECRFAGEWVQFSLGRKATLTHLELEKECARDRDTYLDCVTKFCLSRMNKVIKVIRIRVSWVKELLTTDASLKVIHIVRDPRGSFASLKSLNMAQKNHREWCPKIQEDLLLAESLESSFPKSFLSVKYEELCKDPLGMSLRIWKFLTGRNTFSLPDTWRKYLIEHTMGSKSGNFSTQRDSQKEAEAWRQEISEDTLLEVERDCAKVLELLKYNKFGSLIHARNMSLPLRHKNKLE